MTPANNPVEGAVMVPHECETCWGSGKIVEDARTHGWNQHSACQMDCEDCDGTGWIGDEE